MTDPPLQGQLCVVTGGASGIGRATALALARAGARIAIADRDQSGGRDALPPRSTVGTAGHRHILA